MAAFDIRPIDEGDHADVALIHNACNPDMPTSAEEIAREIGRFGGTRFASEWLVAASPSERGIIGYVTYRHVRGHVLAKYRVTLYVHPSHQRRGIGRRLYETALQQLRERGAQRLWAWTREDQRRAVTFLQRAGFVDVLRDFESRLDVAGADLARFSAYPRRTAELGVTITTLADELDRTPYCLPAVYQMHSTVDMEMPQDDPDPPTPLSYVDFLTQEVRDPSVLLDAYFLAKLGDLYVGESALKCTAGDPRLLHHEITGVISAYRGMGVATALKLRTIAYAQQHGYRTIRTINSDRNVAMLAINGKLGFVRQPAWIGFRMSLTNPAAR